MSAVEVTITGVLYDKLNRTTQQVVLIGEASLTGLGIGGGPIIPPASPGTPTHPIMLPGMPGWGDNLKPSHPIALPGDPWWPTPPDKPPEPPTAVKPPPPEGGWAWTPEWGWGYYPGTGNAGPK